MTRRNDAQSARARVAALTGRPEPCTGAWSAPGGVAVVRHRGGRLYLVQPIDLDGRAMLPRASTLVSGGQGWLVTSPGCTVPDGATAPTILAWATWTTMLADLPTWTGGHLEV